MNITVQAEQLGSERVDITLSADRFAYLVRLSTGKESTRFSDNFFDLEPGESRTISLTDQESSIRADDVSVDTYVSQDCTVHRQSQ